MKSIADIIHNNKFHLCILDLNGELIYFENSLGYWFKQIFDENGNILYSENSDGDIEDNRS